jgi:hypothetical protein
MFSQTIALASRRRTISSLLDGAFTNIAPPFNWHDKDDMQLGEGAGTPDDDVGKA